MVMLSFDDFERCDEVPKSNKKNKKYDYEDIMNRFLRSDMSVAKHTFENTGVAAYFTKKINDVASKNGLKVMATQRVRSVYLSRVK